jgi:hypothetical protein
VIFAIYMEPTGPLKDRDRLAPLDWNSKHISDATLGLDHSRRARVAFELAPEAKDLHVDTAVEDILMDAKSPATGARG